MEKKEDVVIKTKDVMWKGKRYTETFTQSMYDDVMQDANIAKLNGWNFDTFLRSVVDNRIRDTWPEMAASIFKEASPELQVGMGATMNLYSDRRAMTITKIVSPKEIVVQENETKCIDYYAGDYEILDGIAEYMGESVFTLRKNGTWVEKGTPKRPGCVTLTVGYRDHYIDPSF